MGGWRAASRGTGAAATGGSLIAESGLVKGRGTALSQIVLFATEVVCFENANRKGGIIVGDNIWPWAVGVWGRSFYNHRQ